MIQIKSISGRVLYTAENAQDVRAALVEAVKQGADLRGADLQYADLQGAHLQGAHLQGAHLRGADLRGANLGGDLGADLRGADLQDADLQRADLRYADLQRADLQRADLRYADLQGADLRRADLQRADLQRADLRGADLRGADLQGADLRRADLQDADLRRADDPASPLFAIRLDLWSVLDAAPHEVPGLREALIEGRVDGSVYEGDCACLIGTIANVRGVAYTDLEIPRDAQRPAEQWFMPIREGDKPGDDNEGQFRARLAVEWIDQWRESREALVAAFVGQPSERSGR